MMKHLFAKMKRNDDGISPVIGTILMVAATVIVAGAVYAAVNAYNGKTAKGAPDAGFKAQAVDTDGNGLEDMIKITYLSGGSGLAANATVMHVSSGLTLYNATASAPYAASKDTWSPGDYATFATPGSTGGTFFVVVRSGDGTLIDQTLALDE